MTTSFVVPFVNYPAHYRSMEREIDAAIKDALSKGDLILRRQVQDFERRMACFLGVKHAVGVASGTDALILSLRAAGIGPGDEVITVAHTFVATIEAIVHCGATPVLVDVRDDFEMDMVELKRAVTPHSRAVVPVHLNGRLCDMEALTAIARAHNLVVIEDAAQALGASFDGRKAGSFGLSGCFSFYPAKLLGAAGDAGLVCTDGDEFAENIRLLRDHGRLSTDKTKHVCYGFTSRLDNLQAAILGVKLGYMPGWIERRREIAGLYNTGLADVRGVILPPAPSSNGRFFDVYQNYVLRVADRDGLVSYLRDKGIETIVSNPIPVHHQEPLGLSRFHLPNTEQFAAQVVSIPLIPELDNNQVDYVVQAIRAFYLK